jgi:hypothetical protein
VPPAVDHRLVALAKRAFRVTGELRREAFLDHIQLVMGCARVQALNHLDELAQHRLVMVSGHDTSALVFAGADMDTDALIARGVDVRYRP